jgi:DNA-binding NarL/FixJ family response regulator
MEHIRALEKFLERADIEEVKFIRCQIKKLYKKFDTEIKGENEGKLWTPEQEQELIRLVNSGIKLKLIASEMKRTEWAVSMRLEKIASRSTQKQNSCGATE